MQSCRVVFLVMFGVLILNLGQAKAQNHETYKITAGDAGFGDQFGISVDVSGSTAIVGAKRDNHAGSNSGSAYVFDTTTGNQLFKLTAQDAAAEDAFGSSVAISGSTAIVGAQFDNVTGPGTGSSLGSAYLFDLATGDQTLKFTPNGATANARFGSAVGLSQTTAIVGAYRDGNELGAAYVFETGTGNQLFKLTAQDAAAYDQFGMSVAISGTTAIVGANFDDDAGTNSGSAYLFDVSTGDQLFKLTANDAEEHDWFGFAVAISGTRALVSAPQNSDDGNYSGSVYVFDTVTGRQLLKLRAHDTQAGDWFGRSVALSDNLAVVGAHYDDDDGNWSGSSYIFDIDTGRQLYKLTASDAAEKDYFGWDVAISGTTSIVGAYANDDAGHESGSAYIYNEVPEPISLMIMATGCTLLMLHRK